MNRSHSQKRNVFGHGNDNTGQPAPAWPMDFTPKTSTPYHNHARSPYSSEYTSSLFPQQIPIRPESSMSNASFMVPNAFAGGHGGGGVPLYGANARAAPVPSAGSLNVPKGREANPFSLQSPSHQIGGLHEMPYNQHQQIPIPKLDAFKQPQWWNNFSVPPQTLGQYGAPQGPPMTEKAAKAKSLASMIMSGVCSTPDDWEFIQNQSRRPSLAAPATAAVTTRATRSCSRASSTVTPTKSTTANSQERNTKGNPAVFIAVEALDVPHWFDRLAFGYKPSVNDILDDLPFVEGCRVAVASNAGVVRICNIPFNTPRSELTAFVGRNAQVLSQPHGSPYYAVHVIMERHSGKTMDAFIELVSHTEAVTVVNQFMRRMGDGRPPRIGDRAVYVELSSQEELMHELFPRAKRVTWDGAVPRINDQYEEYYPGVPARGFNGFLQDEEIVMMIRHVESPNRSPFVARCPVRPYESLISTIHKYPWFDVQNVFLSERHALFDATLTTIRSLINFLRRAEGAYDPTKPTAATLQELMVACLTCPGFSEQQKMSMIVLAHHGGFANVTAPRGMNLSFGGNFPLASVWPFQVLIKAPGANNTFMEYVAWLLREATDPNLSKLPVDFKLTHDAGRRPLNAATPFGDILINYGTAATLGEMGRIELRYIGDLLARILPRTKEMHSSTANSSPIRQTNSSWSSLTRASSQISLTNYSA